VERSLNVLGTRLVVGSDAPALVEPFLAVFARFADEEGQPQSTREIRVTVDHAAGVFENAGPSIALAPGSLRGAHVYNLLYTTLLRSVEAAYLLHAAAVARDERALLIGGPSGSGKSSLARALAARGFRLLSDDIAPLMIGDRRVYPFPRRLGIVANESKLRQAEFLDAQIVDGKIFVTPESLGLELLSEPRLPGAVVLMNPFIGSTDSVRMTLGVLGEALRFIRRLEGVPGVGIQVSEPQPGLTVVRLDLEGGDAFLAAEREIEAVQRHLLFNVRHHGLEKRYDEVPKLDRITVREAAIDLLRETMNRDSDSALIARLGGGIGRAIFELAGLLRGVACYRLRPADVASTTALLERTLSEVEGEASGA
jgi:hypothetical protein